ncbi:MAG: hypothetical protein ABIK84_02595 [candidate division WOR-3 bacterium]
MKKDKTEIGKGVLFLLCLFLSCPKEKNRGTFYFPLAVGNRWVYEYSALEWSEGEVDTLEKGQVEILITAKDSSGGRELYRVFGKLIVEGDTSSWVSFWGLEEAGILQYDSLGVTFDTFLPLPLEKGRVWRMVSFYLLLLRDEPHSYYAHLFGDDTVRVGEEKFDTAQRIDYTLEEEEIRGSFWLVKEIGLVKLVDKEGDMDSYTEFIFDWKREG